MKLTPASRVSTCCSKWVPVVFDELPLLSPDGSHGPSPSPLLPPPCLRLLLPNPEPPAPELPPPSHAAGEGVADCAPRNHQLLTTPPLCC